MEHGGKSEPPSPYRRLRPITAGVGCHAASAACSRACALQPHWFHRMATRDSDADQISRIGFFCFSNWKGPTMRIFTASVIVAALALGTPAFVQAQGAPAQSGAETPPAQSGTVIRSIQVVD